MKSPIGIQGKGNEYTDMLEGAHGANGGRKSGVETEDVEETLSAGVIV